MKNQMKLLNMDPGAKTRWRLQASSEKGSRITAQAIIYLTPITLRAHANTPAHTCEWKIHPQFSGWRDTTWARQHRC